MTYIEDKDPLTGKGKRHTKSALAVLGLSKSVIEDDEEIKPLESEITKIKPLSSEWVKITSSKSIRKTSLNPILIKILKIDNDGTIIFASIRYKSLQDLYKDEERRKSTKRGFNEKYGITWGKFMKLLGNSGESNDLYRR